MSKQAKAQLILSDGRRFSVDVPAAVTAQWLVASLEKILQTVGGMAEVRRLRERLQMVLLPQQVHVIEHACFRFCSALQMLSAPGVNKLEDSALTGCRNLAWVDTQSDHWVIARNIFLAARAPMLFAPKGFHPEGDYAWPSEIRQCDVVPEQLPVVEGNFKERLAYVRGMYLQLPEDSRDGLQPLLRQRYFDEKIDLAPMLRFLLLLSSVRVFDHEGNFLTPKLLRQMHHNLVKQYRESLGIVFMPRRYKAARFSQAFAGYQKFLDNSLAKAAHCPVDVIMHVMPFCDSRFDFLMRARQRSVFAESLTTLSFCAEVSRHPAVNPAVMMLRQALKPIRAAAKSAVRPPSVPKMTLSRSVTVRFKFGSAKQEKLSSKQKKKHTKQKKGKHQAEKQPTQVVAQPAAKQQEKEAVKQQRKRPQQQQRRKKKPTGTSAQQNNVASRAKARKQKQVVSVAKQSVLTKNQRRQQRKKSSGKSAAARVTANGKTR